MDFYDTLTNHGFRLKEAPLPGDKIRRCKTDAKPGRKNGWYRLALDGKTGWFGDFSTGFSATWKADKTTMSLLPQVNRAEIEKARAEERKIAGHAIASARKAWENLPPMRAIHPYIESKNLSVQGCGGVRVDVGARWFRAWYKHKGVELHMRDDLLVIPMYRAGQLMSIQAIAPNGKKLFWKDAPTKGCYLELRRPASTITILAEGFATGLCLFQCIPQASVIVCFNADNMAYIAADLNLSGMVVVAADNDHATAAKLLAQTGVATNPGIDKGKKAAEAIGCQAVWPEGIQGSDWSDAFIEWNSPSRVRTGVLQGVRHVMKGKTPA
jgi:putative DNA primase/helicase